MILATIVVASSIAPFDLRVNALSNPMAIQGVEPEFSWKLNSTDAKLKGLRQKAYRILVATNPNLLKQEIGDLWDSGVVNSPATYGVKYAGKRLQPRLSCFWKLQVWDQDGVAAKWSSSEQFATGLDKFKAKWIHGDRPQSPGSPLDGARWIWSDSFAGDQTPATTHTFTQSWSISAKGKTTLYITADDTVDVKVNGKSVALIGQTNNWRELKVVDISSLVTSGKNSIQVVSSNLTVGPAGLVATIKTEAGGKTEIVQTDGTWLGDGRPVKDLFPYGRGSYGSISGLNVVAPAQYFTKPFEVKKKVFRATLYASALGMADLILNDKRVTEDLFTPGWMDYNKRVQYRAFDITKSLKQGANSLGAILSQGWYSGYVAWGSQREHWGDTPKLVMQAEIEYTDGTTEMIGTDESWKYGEGPVRDEHFLHGEKYDANTPITTNKSALVAPTPTIPVDAFDGDPVREYTRLKAKTITKQGDSKYLIDYGQNLSGFVRLKVNYPAGTKITIRHGERLDKDGNLYTENLRLAKAIDTYTCKGGGEEWNPRFTFHGFQFIEVSGVPTAPSKDTFTAIAISSSTPESGSLKTSDAMLNKLVSNAWWTQKMNFVDVPTDCPQRDERLGWTGDAQAYIRTATYYSDVQAFFQRWLVTLDDSQSADGNYPKVAPVLKGLDDGGPAWGDAGVICPMTIYQVYGDKTLLARHYPQMKKFIEFCRARSTPKLLPPKSYHIFGDWLSINANTPPDVITTAYFAGSTKIVADAARILGNRAEAAEYDELHEKIKSAFQSAYIDEEGHVKGETQTGYVLALYFDLMPKELVEKASSHLIKNIEDRKWHLSTGFVGTRDLMHVLSKIGRNDVAFRLLHNTTFPSWGFPIVNGATSIWERWDGWTPERGFQDVGMNSFAHYAYGAVVGWMFEKIGGVKELKPGFEEILIAPEIDPNLTFADCVYKSVRGDIKTRWEKKSGTLTLTVSVPVNTSAVIKMPGEKGLTEHRVGSGDHVFTSTWSAK